MFSIVTACCLCWKRKATDVLPAHLEARPFDPYKPKPKPKVKREGRWRKEAGPSDKREHAFHGSLVRTAD